MEKEIHGTPNAEALKDLLEGDYSIYLTDGKRKNVEEAFSSSPVRLFVWCARGVDECSNYADKLTTSMFSPEQKPRVAIICMEFGAEYVARRLYIDAKVERVVWIRMDPYGHGLYSLFMDVFLPFCDSFIPQKETLHTCIELLVSRAKHFCVGCECGWCCPDEEAGAAEHTPAVYRPLPTSKGKKLILTSKLSRYFTAKLFRLRKLKQLKVYAGDLEIWRSLEREVNQIREGDHFYIFVGPDSSIDMGERQLKKACERSRALALYFCNQIADRDVARFQLHDSVQACARRFDNGIFRIASEDDKKIVKRELLGKSIAALLWLDFEESPLFDGAIALQAWLKGFGEELALTLLFTSGEKHLEHLKQILGDLDSFMKGISMMLTDTPIGIDISVGALVGIFSLRAVGGDNQRERRCLLDDYRPEEVERALKEVFSAHGQGRTPGFRMSLYRADNGSVQVSTFVSDIKFLTMLRECGLHEKAMQAKMPSEKILKYLQFEPSSIAKMYESMILQLESLTPHQREKLAECEAAKRVHIKAPAGTGKTFIALNAVLDYLEISKEGSVLYVCRNSSLGFYFCKWLCSRVQQCTGSVDLKHTLNRIFLLNAEWSPNIRGVEVKGDQLTDKHSSGGPLFGKIIIDEAHDIFGKKQDGVGGGGLRQTVSDVLERQNQDSEWILLSDDAQASASEFDYPDADWTTVTLTEVCRSSKRIILGAKSYQLENVETDCAHESDGPLLRSCLFAKPAGVDIHDAYAIKIGKAINDVIEEFPGLDLHNRLAIIVPDKPFRKALCGSPIMEKSLASNRFVSVTAVDASRNLQMPGSPEDGSHIVIDTVDEVDGLESLFVFGVGLDESIDGGKAPRVACSRIYRAITRTQLFFYLINEKVAGGWFDWLHKVKTDTGEVDLEAESSRASNLSALNIVRLHEKGNASDDTSSTGASAIVNSPLLRDSEEQGHPFGRGLDEQEQLEKRKDSHEQKHSKSHVWDNSANEPNWGSDNTGRISSLFFDPTAVATDVPEEKTNTEGNETAHELHASTSQSTRNQAKTVGLKKGFLSHTGQDVAARNFTAHLKDEMEKLGLPCFYDVRIRPGVLWKDSIETAVVDCGCFVAILSPTYFQRYWCMHELDLALNNNRPVLPVYYSLLGPKELPHDKDAFCSAFENDKRVTEGDLDRWWHNINNLEKISGVFRTNTKNADVSLKVVVVNWISQQLQ